MTLSAFRAVMESLEIERDTDSFTMLGKKADWALIQMLVSGGFAFAGACYSALAL